MKTFTCGGGDVFEKLILTERISQVGLAEKLDIANIGEWQDGTALFLGAEKVNLLGRRIKLLIEDTDSFFATQ